MELSEWATKQVLFTAVLAGISLYAATRYIYLTVFHPLAKFPGPRIAAVSNVWYGYHWLSGRYPWAIERAFEQYGDVVRIAPNELAFFSHQAFKDVLGGQSKGLETFVKTDFNRRGEDSGGIIYEEDPVQHRQLLKQLSPAFSSRSLKAMESVLHHHIDLFVQKMSTKGKSDAGVSLVDWTNWLTMDIAADMAYCQDKGEMEEEKNALYLQILLDFNKMSPAIWVFKRFPLLGPLRNLFLPFSKIKTYAAFKRFSEVQLAERIEHQGATDHVDYFELLLPSGGDNVVTSPGELAGLGVAARQLVFAGYQPVSDWLYSTLFYLAHEPDAYAALVAEIRGTFQNYEDITPEALASLPYLNGCLQESLRLFPGNNSGLPRYSPGAVIDGTYVPKGISVQTSFFSRGRSPRYYHEARRFRPQRFLPHDHKLFDTRFAEDSTDELYAFSLGLRACLGQGLSWIEGRLCIAKLFWSLDMTTVPGQQIDLEKDLTTYGFWVKPDLKIRFLDVKRA